MSSQLRSQAQALGLVSPDDSFNRDGRGRPIVTRPRFTEEGAPMVGEPLDGTVTYTRCTTFVDALSDAHGLAVWGRRHLAVGLAAEPDLLANISGMPDPGDDDAKAALDQVIDQAIGAAGGNTKRETGTALHAACQAWERGQDPAPLTPAGQEATVAAYQEAITAARLRIVRIEQPVVCDPLQVAGTTDAVYRLPDGRAVIADIKTGTVDRDPAKIAMQMAVYAHSVYYDRHTGLRSAPEPVDQARGLLIHLPAGAGVCELHWVDLAAGWQAVELAWKVRRHRAANKPATWYRPYQGGTGQALDAGTTSEAAQALLVEITNAASVDALNTLWATHQATWTSQHTQAARARKTTLTSR